MTHPAGCQVLLSTAVLNHLWCCFTAVSLNLDVPQHLQHLAHTSAQPLRFPLSLKQVADPKTSHTLAAKQTHLQPSSAVYSDPCFSSPRGRKRRAGITQKQGNNSCKRGEEVEKCFLRDGKAGVGKDAELSPWVPGQSPHAWRKGLVGAEAQAWHNKAQPSSYTNTLLAKEWQTGGMSSTPE